jgi:hypothetical protein
MKDVAAVKTQVIWDISNQAQDEGRREQHEELSASKTPAGTLLTSRGCDSPADAARVVMLAVTSSSHRQHRPRNLRPGRIAALSGGEAVNSSES